MDIERFLREPSLWRRPISGLQRSTLLRIASGKTAPKVATAQDIISASDRYSIVTESTLTPLPLPCVGTRAPWPTATPVPVFDLGDGQLVGNFHGLAIHHRPGEGGTFLLAMMTLIAVGAGWGTWLIDPKGEAGRYFPDTSAQAKTDTEISTMLLDVATQIRRRTPRTRPLLISIDQASHVIANATAEVLDAFTTILTTGREHGVVVNVDLEGLDNLEPAELLPPLLELLPVHLGPDLRSARLSDRPCRKPQLFVDYLLVSDTADVDYRRYLHATQHTPHYPENRYSRLATDLVEHGVRHAWGGGGVDGPSCAVATPTGSDTTRVGFDAGSLAQYLHYQAEGITLGRTTFRQFDERGPEVHPENAEPGDLLWPRGEDDPYTVATYLGGNAAVDAGHQDGYVRIVHLDDLGPITVTRPTN